MVRCGTGYLLVKVSLGCYLSSPSRSPTTGIALHMDPKNTSASSSANSSSAAQAGLFQCGLCKNSYKRLDHLSRHVRSRESTSCIPIIRPTRGRGDTFPCSGSGSRSRSNSRSELEGKRCCWKTRAGADELGPLHMVVRPDADTQSKPYQCHICAKAFGRT